MAWVLILLGAIVGGTTGIHEIGDDKIGEGQITCQATWVEPSYRQDCIRIGRGGGMHRLVVGP
ncbi:MAG: hypothetical protein ABGX16_19690 [Pirellulales bacterium]